MFLVFQTQEEAQSANQQIINNIRSYLLQYIPARVCPNGLISVNTDGNPIISGTITTDWDIPKEYQEGWAIIKPEQEKLGRVPVSVALNGVGGSEVTEITPIIISSE